MDFDPKKECIRTGKVKGFKACLRVLSQLLSIKICKSVAQIEICNQNTKKKTFRQIFNISFNDFESEITN